MTLADDVYPAALSLLRGIQNPDGTPLFKGISEGATDSIPDVPWGWLEFAHFSAPQEEGKDREITDWRMTLTVFWYMASDRGNAETSIIKLIEPIRFAVRRHVKMGRKSIERVRVTDGRGGFVKVNSIWYRTITITFAVRERVGVTHFA